MAVMPLLRDPASAVRTPLVVVLVLVLAVPLLAGCLGQTLPPAPEGAGDVGGGLDAAAPAFTEPRLIGPGGDAETSLTIGPNGTMLACSHGGFRKPSPLWMSDDGGTTWTEMDPRPNPVPSGDCDVAVGDDGQLYMMYDTVASATVAATRDGGRSWTVNPVAALPVGGVDRPWIAAGPGDDLYLLYQNVAVAEPALDMFARSTDGGATWTEHSVISVTDPPDRTHDIVGDMVVSDDGATIRAPMLRWNAFAGDSGQRAPKWVGLATSTDRGASWSVENVAGPVDVPLQIPALTLAGDGSLYMALTTWNETLADINFLHSADEGATWTGPVRVADGYGFPAVKAAWVDGRPDGSATMAWMHVNETGWQVSAARIDAAAEDPVAWVRNLTPRRDVDNLFEFIMVDHDAEGLAHVVYPMAGEGCARPLVAQDNRNLQCVRIVSEVAVADG